LTLPNFLIIGAMRGGTTSLWQYLRSHPQVFMPGEKEVHFFSREHVWSRGVEWYQSRFSEVPATAIAIGEASPSYTKHPHLPGVPARIASVVPEARLIYVIRHPIERMRSHYLHHVLAGDEHQGIEKALRPGSEYVDTSRYAMQVDNYLEHFRRDQLLLITSEDLRTERVSVLNLMYRFLEVEEGWIPPTIEREFFLTGERRKLRSIPLKIRRLAGRRLRRLIPPALKARIAHSRLAAGALDEVATTIPDPLRKELEDLLREDVRRLKGVVGPGFDGWGLA
jgi:Sulfotransferase domain